MQLEAGTEVELEFELTGQDAPLRTRGFVLRGQDGVVRGEPGEYGERGADPRQNPLSIH